MRLEMCHRNPVVPSGRRVVVAEPVAKVIPPLAALRGARLEAEFARPGIETKVTAAEVDLRTRLVADDPASAVAIRPVQPAVEPPAKPVDEVLRIARRETAEPGLADVAAVITILILREEDVG